VGLGYDHVRGQLRDARLVHPIKRLTGAQPLAFA
jgi:hypothetical protein